MNDCDIDRRLDLDRMDCQLLMYISHFCVLLIRAKAASAEKNKQIERNMNGTDYNMAMTL